MTVDVRSQRCMRDHDEGCEEGEGVRRWMCDLSDACESAAMHARSRRAGARAMGAAASVLMAVRGRAMGAGGGEAMWLRREDVATGVP